MSELKSIVRMQDSENPNLIWITETSGGKKTERTEETTESITNTSTDQVNEMEEVITQQITRTIVKKTLSVLNNTTT